MPDFTKLLEQFRVPNDQSIRLRDYDPGWAGDKDVPKADRKKYAESILSQEVAELAEAQELLWASDSYSLLLILQAMDAAGKDSTIEHVMSGVNPQGCRVWSFKQPSTEELDHNFLWRYAKALPERGSIGIFNRSYYEEVLVVRVHPELLDKQRIPDLKRGGSVWKNRFEDINNFELHLSRNGTAIVKVFLHVSKEEQLERFLKRLEEPDKLWKFSEADLKERAFWDDYQSAFEEMLNNTSTAHAPWYVIPADHKWVARALVARLLTSTIEKMNIEYPSVGPEDKARYEEIRLQLRQEAGIEHNEGHPEKAKKSKGKEKDKDNHKSSSKD